MKSLASKLCRIYGKVSALEKEGNNSFAKYKYFTEGQMLQYLRPLMTEEGLFIFHSTEEIIHREVKRGGGDKTELHSIVKTVHTIVDSETGEQFTVKSVGEGIDSGDKATYKAITGATKYLYMKMFGITDSQDPENDSHDVKQTRVAVIPQIQVATPKVEEPKPVDNFFRKALLKTLSAEGITEKFVIDGCHSTKWIDASITTIDQLPEGKAKQLIEMLPKIKERFLAQAGK